MREQSQRIFGAFTKMCGAGNRILERACFLQILNGQFKVGLIIGIVAGCLCHGALGQHDRQGDFALAEIFTGIFAQHTIDAAIIERVIDQLKRNAKIFTIGF